jgi:hypothetical protein
MQDFMTAYNDVAQQQYEMSMAVKELPYYSNTANTAEAKEEKYYETRRHIDKSLNRNANYNRNVNKHSSLNHVQLNEHSDSEDSCDSNWAEVIPITAEAGTDDKQATQLEEDSEEELYDSGDDEVYKLTLNAFGDHQAQKLDKKDLACFRKITTGKCELEGCPYGHRRDVLIKGANDMKAKMKAFLDSSGGPPPVSKDNPPGGAPYMVLNKEKYGNKN